VEEFRKLFNVGATAALTDGQLLERFTTLHGERAELAFAAILERHGPMVLRTCLGMLKDDHDAMDALQATFLILARKGGGLWVRDSLGPWIHRVACRVALRAKLAASRRRVAERLAGERQAAVAAQSVGELDRTALGGVLHEEVDRLPDRYRVPIVLCDFEGRTYEEAARHLGCPVGTVKSRLARGREQLRGRLFRRGVAPSAGVPGAVLASEVGMALPRAAWESIATAALRVATGEAEAAGAVPEAVLALANAASRSMVLMKWKWAAATVLAASVLCYGAARAGMWALGAGLPDSPAPDASAVTAGPAERRPSEERRVPPFGEVRAAGKIKVVVTPGPNHRVVATGTPDLLRGLRTRVEKHLKHGRLVIDLSASEEGKDGNAVEVRVTTPSLIGVIAEGSAAVEVRGFKNQSLALTVSNTAKVEAAGSCDSLTAVLGDGGRLDASRLDAGDASVTAWGSSTGIFLVRNTLSVMTGGDARVEYLGTPRQVNKITSGRSQLVPRPIPSSP
jgi:RNA polymerase sigma factor (sigma-70 family)